MQQQGLGGKHEGASEEARLVRSEREGRQSQAAGQRASECVCLSHSRVAGAGARECVSVCACVCVCVYAGSAGVAVAE